MRRFGASMIIMCEDKACVMVRVYRMNIVQWVDHLSGLHLLLGMVFKEEICFEDRRGKD
jgi:hypothetical protein